MIRLGIGLSIPKQNGYVMGDARSYAALSIANGSSGGNITCNNILFYELTQPQNLADDLAGRYISLSEANGSSGGDYNCIKTAFAELN